MVAGSLVAGGLVVGAAGLTGVATADGLAAPDLSRLSTFVAKDDGGKGEGKGTGPTAGNGKRGETTGRDEKGPKEGSEGWGQAPDDVTQVPCDSRDLIDAVVTANAEGGGTLKLAPKCTYVLTESADSGPGREGTPADTKNDRTGLPVIYHPVTIEGEGATLVRDRQATEFRFFTVRNGGELVLRNLTLENGSAAVGGSVHVEHDATATIDRLTVKYSTASSNDLGGGAVFNDGHMTIKESKFIENRAAGKTGRGGAILNGGVFTVAKSEFVKNSASAIGGGLANYQGAADISGSTFARNDADKGGGIASFNARTKVWDTKLVENQATIGGGVANNAAVITMRNMTIRANTALVDGGGISTVEGLVALDDSVVQGNTAYGDGAGIYSEKSKALVRGTEVGRNEGVATRSRGAGIFAQAGQLSLFKSKVADNESRQQPGGVSAKFVQVVVDDETVIRDNRPTNCAGSPVPIPNCFN